MDALSRRELLQRGAILAGGTALAFAPGATLAQPQRPLGFGPLIEDRGGLLDLPRGFRYRVISPEGSTLASGPSKGAAVPGDHDGMAASRGPRNTGILVRNHELRSTESLAVPATNP